MAFRTRSKTAEKRCSQVAETNTILPFALWEQVLQRLDTKDFAVAACTCRAFNKMLPGKVLLKVSSAEALNWAQEHWSRADTVELILLVQNQYSMDGRRAPDRGAWLADQRTKGIRAPQEAQSITIGSDASYRYKYACCRDPQIGWVTDVLQQCNRLKYLNLHRVSGQLRVPPLQSLHHVSIELYREAHTDAQLCSITEMKNLRTLRLARYQYSTDTVAPVEPHGCLDVSAMPNLTRVSLVDVAFEAMSLPSGCTLHVGVHEGWTEEDFDKWSRVAGLCDVVALQINSAMRFILPFEDTTEWPEIFLSSNGCTSLAINNYATPIGQLGQHPHLLKNRPPLSFLGPKFAQLVDLTLISHTIAVEIPSHLDLKRLWVDATFLDLRFQDCAASAKNLGSMFVEWADVDKFSKAKVRRFVKAMAKLGKESKREEVEVLPKGKAHRLEYKRTWGCSCGACGKCVGQPHIWKSPLDLMMDN